MSRRQHTQANRHGKPTTRGQRLGSKLGQRVTLKRLTELLAKAPSLHKPIEPLGPWPPR